MKGDYRKISLNAILQYLAGFNYSHACRMVLGMALAWFIAFRLQTDRPYWAMMTVAIVTLPIQRMLVENFLARFIGTVVGVVSVNIIAALALNDQWLFVIYMAIWLAICSYLASSLSRLFTYGFALCGYTAALVGFALSVAPSAYAFFQISQARVLEIYIGLVTAFFISMLWPAFSERIEIRYKLREKRTQARGLYQSLLTVDNDHKSFYKEYRAVLLGLIDFRELIFYEFLSASSNTTENTRLYRYGNRLLQAISGILLLDMLKRELLKTNPEAMTKYLFDLNKWFSSASLSQGKLAHKPQAPNQLVESTKGLHFIEFLDEKLEEILSAQYRYEHADSYTKEMIEEEEEDLATLRRGKFYIPGFSVYYSDKKEALLNAVRTFLCIMAGMFFWMETQWDFGFVLLILIGIICTIGSTLAMVTKVITMILSSMMLVAIPISFVLKFGILIQVSTMEVAMLIVLPIYFIAALLQGRSAKGVLIGLGVLIFSPMLVSFSNPMEFDIGVFANTSLTMVVAFVILLLMFNIIRPSSSDAKLARVRLSIFNKFKILMQPKGRYGFSLKRLFSKGQQNSDKQAKKINQHLASNISEKTLRDYEAYVYSAIHQIRLLPDNKERSLFVVYAYMTFAILRGQLRFKRRGELWHLPVELFAALETEDLEEALAIVMRQKETGSEHEKLAYWELQCALMALQEFLGTEAET